MRRPLHRAGRNCHNFLAPAWRRRQVLAENLEKDWCELRRHASIERDPEKLSQLNADLDKKKTAVKS